MIQVEQTKQPYVKSSDGIDYVDAYDMFKEDPYRKQLKERNDCTVRALACVMNSSYVKAHEHTRKFKLRELRRGMLHHLTLTLHSTIKHHKVAIGPYRNNNRITVGQFLKKHSQGRFFVCVRGHAFAIIDGVIHDYKISLRRQIVYAFRVYLNR